MTDGIVKGIRQFRDKLGGLEKSYYSKTDEIQKAVEDSIKSILPADWFDSEDRKKAVKNYGIDTLTKVEGSSGVQKLLAQTMARAKKKK